MGVADEIISVLFHPDLVKRTNHFGRTQLPKRPIPAIAINPFELLCQFLPLIRSPQTQPFSQHPQNGAFEVAGLGHAHQDGMVGGLGSEFQ